MLLPAEQFLARLVGFPTISTDIAACDQALAYVAKHFVACGLHVTHHRFNGHGALVASTRTNNQKKPTVLLAAHIDVMHGSEQLFTLRTTGDKLLGRGVYDMKFAIAGYMQLASELRHKLASYDFAIMITSDEEIGSKDGVNSTRHLVEAGYLPGVCVLPDSTAPGWDIESLAKGHWRFQLTAHGKTAHGSRPWEGDSAAFKLISALQELRLRFKDHGPRTDSLNIAVIEGGEAFNQVPDTMTASIEIRLVADNSYQKNQAWMQQLCERYGLTLATRSMVPPLHQDLAHPLVASFTDSIEAVTGRQPEQFISLAGSDAPYFVRAGVPCAVSCPLGGKHHSEQEWLSRRSFRQFVPILRRFLDTTARIDPPSRTPAKAVDSQAVLV